MGARHRKLRIVFLERKAEYIYIFITNLANYPEIRPCGAILCTYEIRRFERSILTDCCKISHLTRLGNRSTKDPGH